MQLTIAAVPPSLNVYMNLHWRERSRLRDDWTMLVMAASAGCAPLQAGYKRVCVTLHLRRLRDVDNAYGGIKPLVDALRHRGLIADDDPGSIELVMRQYKCKVKDERTEVMIEEAAR